MKISGFLCWPALACFVAGCDVTIYERHPAHAPAREPLISVTISEPERRVIYDYVESCQKPPRGKKPKKVPPGLAKKGGLPPGWQKKVARGEVMSVEVYRQCHPLPQEVVVKLPPPPRGTILVAVEGKVVRLLEATREILDVFEIGN